MGARAQKVDDVAGDVEQRTPRRRWKDLSHSFILTAPAADGHTHCAMFNAMTGRGVTTPGRDGHVHRVQQLEIVVAAGHAHDLSSTRCPLEHDENGRHAKTQPPGR